MEQNGMRLHIRTIGTFSITEFGRPIDLPRTKEKALVAFLAVNRKRVFQRASLADLLWDSSSDNRSRHSLNQALYSIRRLMPRVLAFEGDCVGFAELQIRTDLDDIHDRIDEGKIDEALSALDGSFLGSLVVAGASQFEDWRDEFETSYRRIIDHRLQQALSALGRKDRESLLRHVPVSLMQSLPLTIQGIAVASMSAPNPGGNPSGSEPNIAVPRIIHTLPFIGRDPEIDRLKTWWAHAQGREPRFVLIRGLPGLGKTRLAQEFAASVAGARLINIRCYQSEKRIAFCAIGTTLMNEIDSNDLRTIDEPWHSAISQLMPSTSHGSGVSTVRGSALSQMQLFEAIRRLLINICKDSSALIMIDDVQWADPSTRALLLYLSFRLTNLPLMIVATIRAKGRATPSDFQHWDVIDLQELDTKSISEIAEVVRAEHTVDLPSDTDIIRVTRGHPYLLSAFLRSVIAGHASAVVQESGTLNVNTFVGSIIRTLPSGSQLTLAALAILGHPVTPSMLRQIVRTKRMERHLDVLLNRGLVDVSSSGVTLRHDLVREATYKRIPLLTRGDLHRRAATALAKDSRRAGEAAEHFYKGGERKLAYDWAVKAAEDADSRHAYQEAVTFLKLATRCIPDVDGTLHTRLADRLHRLSRIAEARQEVQKAFESDVSAENAAELSIMELELGYALGDLKGESLRNAIRKLQSEGPPLSDRQVFRILRLKLRSAHHEAIKGVAEEVIRELRDFAYSTSSPVQVEALAFAARAHSFLTSATEAEQWLQPFVDKIHTVEDPSIRLTAMALMAANYYDVGKLVDAERALITVLEETERTGVFSEWPLHASYLHMIYIEQGKYTQALDLRSSVLTKIIPEEIRHFTAPFASNETMMYFEVGDFDRAESAALETMQYVEKIRSVWLEISTLGLLGLIHLQKGRLSKAQECCDILLEHLDSRPYLAGDVSYIQIFLSRMALLHQRPEEAIARLEQAIEAYHDRDVVCRLRMQLELARVLKHIDRQKARELAKHVYEAASEINARPIADRADGLLLRF